MDTVTGYSANYWNRLERPKVVVRVAEGESNPCVIGRRVCQECPWSPVLFSIYVKMMVVEAMKRVEEGVALFYDGNKYLPTINYLRLQIMCESTKKFLEL